MKQLIVLLTLALLPACAGVETGNGRSEGTTTATVKLALRSTGGAAPVTHDAQGTAFTFTAARAVVRHVELSLPDGRPCSELDLGGLDPRIACDASGLRVEGPFLVDLLTGAATPALADIAVPAGVYDRVDVRFHDDEDAVPPGDPLAGYTLLVEGTFGSDAKPFRLRLAFNEDARFERPGGLALAEDAAQTVLLWLDVSAWFEELPLTECLSEGRFDEVGGVIQIEDSGGGCSDIENALKEAIKESSSLE